MNGKTHKKKMIKDNNSCVDNCVGFIYENNDFCYSICPEDVDSCKSEKESTIITITSNIISTINYQEVNNIDSTNIYSTNNIKISSSSNELFASTYISKEISTDIKIPKNNEEIYQEIITKMMEELSLLEEEEIIIEGADNFVYQITTSENEKGYLIGKKNITNKLSKIDLGECENILKENYHINKTNSLIILKFEKISNISSERVLQYEVYEPLNKTKLNLSICDSTTIHLYIPIVLSDGLNHLYNEVKNLGYDLFDENSAFYQDICTPFKSPNGTDVSLNDRYDYYYNNNETICQSNCNFSYYDIETQYLKCECDISNSEIDTEAITKLTAKSFFNSFYDSLKFSNYKVLKCYNLVFSLKALLSNYGSIIAFIYFLIYIVFFVLYCINGINPLKIDFAKKVIKDPMHSNANNGKSNNNFNNTLKTERKSLRKISIKTSVNTKEIKEKKYPPRKSLIRLNRPFSKKRKTEIQNAKNVQILNNNTRKRRTISMRQLDFSKNILIKNKNNNIKPDNIENNQKENLDNFELNNLEYDLAIKLDKRNFLETYLSILKREHLIFFTFLIRNDYNIVSIKFARFIFLLCTDMALNVFFFADETMHKMFLDYGKYNFIQQINQIIYSTLVSQLIELLLGYLSLTDKHFYEIKNLDNKNKYKVFQIIKCIKIKLSFFFLFTFIMFFFYWYAISCFCSVYKNTQIAFIKDSISSFGLGLLYPFVLYLFPASLRIIALRASKFHLICLYKLSDVIPFF